MGARSSLLSRAASALERVSEWIPPSALTVAVGVVVVLAYDKFPAEAL